MHNNEHLIRTSSAKSSQPYQDSASLVTDEDKTSSVQGPSKTSQSSPDGKTAQKQKREASAPSENRLTLNASSVNKENTGQDKKNAQATKDIVKGSATSSAQSADRNDSKGDQVDPKIDICDDANTVKDNQPDVDRKPMLHHTQDLPVNDNSSRTQSGKKKQLDKSQQKNLSFDAKTSQDHGNEGKIQPQESVDSTTGHKRNKKVKNQPSQCTKSRPTSVPNSDSAKTPSLVKSSSFPEYETEVGKETAQPQLRSKKAVKAWSKSSAKKDRELEELERLEKQLDEDLQNIIDSFSGGSTFPVTPGSGPWDMSIVDNIDNKLFTEDEKKMIANQKRL